MYPMWSNLGWRKLHRFGKLYWIPSSTYFLHYLPALSFPWSTGKEVMVAIPPHPALAASAHLIPALKSYWPSLQSHFAKHGGYASLNAFKLYYIRSDPLHSAISICGAFTVYVYVMQQLTGNASQVDGLWTFLPVIYGAHFAFQKQIAAMIDPPKLGFLSSTKGQSLAENIDPRLALMFGLQVCIAAKLWYWRPCTDWLTAQVLWSCRLTYNAIRRGMFKKWVLAYWDLSASHW